MQAPEAVREHLLMKPEKYKTLAEMIAMIEEYIVEHAGADDEDLDITAMDKGRPRYEEKDWYV